MSVVVRENEPLAGHTAWRTGGPCDGWIVVHEEADLADALATIRARGWKWTVLGAGTRTVVKDGGLTGAVIRLGTGFSRISIRGAQVEVGAAAPIAALAWATVGAARGGVAGWAGHPGSVGAALVLDAIDWPVTSVRFFRRGAVIEGSLDDLRKQRAIALGATLTLPVADRDGLVARARASLAEEHGPWFAGPARATLRDTDLGGTRLRSVALAQAQPELLVNLGRGTARDLALLHRSVVDRVQRRTGRALDSAVVWAGR